MQSTRTFQIVLECSVFDQCFISPQHINALLATQNLTIKDYLEEAKNLTIKEYLEEAMKIGQVKLIL
jgi:hypothetical protein